jgi:Tol biopolymer transport system component
VALGAPRRKKDPDMKTRAAFHLMFGACLALLVLPHESASAQGCSTVRASVSSSGAQGDAGVGQADMSADGRYVVFTTTSSAIVPTNGWSQVARHDLVTGATILVSAAPGGAPANSVCETPHASADGRWVCFSSRSTNLVPGDPSFMSDIFLHDCDSGTNYLASRSTAGEYGNDETFDSAISGDGRYVAFATASSNLVPDDTNGYGDVFVFDRDAGTTELVSSTASGVQGDRYSVHPSISNDGRYVAFGSLATTFHPADVNGLLDVFVKDRVTGALVLVSARPDGLPSNGNSDYPAISGDGNYVAFQSVSTDLGPPDQTFFITNDVFVRDLLSSTTSVIDRTVLGGPPTGQAEYPRISFDGRFVVFESASTDLVIGDTNGANDVFLHDRERGQTLRVNLTNSDLQTGGFSGRPAVSDDGRRVAFISTGSDLAPDDTNGVFDAFVRTCPTPSGTAFCAGDGTATACPCANFGALGSGCASASQIYGGHLFALGAASVSADTFVLRGEGLLASFITYFQGTAQVNGGQGIVFGDGLLCAGGSIIRLGTKFSTGGVSGYPAAGDPAISIKGLIPPGGGSRTYQGWYRAAAPFCTPDTFNMTNGLEVVWQP